MTVARTIKSSQQDRTRLIRLVHVRRKETSLDDDTWRDLLERETGKRSAADLTIDELRRVATVLGGHRAVAQRPEERKARALWHAAWHLGLLEVNNETAFRAFVRRQTGVEGPAWVRGDWVRVIEALKAWLERDGGVNFDETIQVMMSMGGMGRQMTRRQINPRTAVVIAQWQRLADLGAVRIADPAALNSWLDRQNIVSCSMSAHQMPDDALDAAQRKLGDWLRRVQSSPDGHDG